MKKSRLSVFAILIVTMATIFALNINKVANNINLGLDLQGGFEIVYEVSPLDGKEGIPEMNAVAKSISKRIDVLGVNEPQIIIEGENRIRVQLAGVSDQNQARRILTSTANLTFRDVNDNLLMGPEVIKEGGASLSFDNGIPVVSLKIADTDKFYEITKNLSAQGSGKNLIVTWLDFDPEVDSYAAEREKELAGQETAYISAATVSTGISGDAVISGNFTNESAKELADLINSGSLPVKMTELYSNVVSAEYGTGAYEKTMLAGMIGVIIVMVFMVFVYRLPGIISAFMLFMYILFVLFVYNLMGGVFTLPGIAGLVLGVGMTVDANIITFERIKDELYNGRSLKRGYEEGCKHAFSTIFDSQFTTFIAAIIMYLLGTGAVKGFSTMLMITIVGTLLLNVYLSRLLLGLLVNSGYFDNKKSWFGVKISRIPDLAKNEERKYFGHFTKIDFVKIGRYFYGASLIYLLVGVIFMGFNGMSGKGFMNFGIDFASGTKITIQSDESLSVDSVKDQFAQLGYDNLNRVVLSGSNNEYASVTMKAAIDQDSMYELKEKLEGIYGHEPNDSVVTPVVGRELVRNALLACAIAWIAMLAYITIRYEMDYAICCIVALLHDVLFVLCFFAIFRIEVDSTLVAVILSIIGYSIDDSIVIFDRIRETVESMGHPKHPEVFYRDAVNHALQQTGERSLINTLTTLFPMVSLLVLGSQSIFTFNLAMFVGLIAGAYSSIFIAAQLWYYIRVHRKPKEKKHKPRKKSDEISEWNVPGINA